MAKRKKQSEAVLIKGYAERFRKLPDTLCPHTKFEGEQEWQKTPADPIELWLIKAGQLLRLVLRYNYVFTDDRHELIRGFEERKSGKERAEIWLWQEVVKNLRARVGLYFPLDYLKTFTEDCNLVADVLEKEAEGLAGVDESEKGIGKRILKGALKRAVISLLDEWPEIESKETELTSKVNEKLKSWGYKETTKKSVKTTLARIRKEKK